jgi:hypothetical protein
MAMRYEYQPDYESFASSMEGYGKLMRIFSVLAFVRKFVVPAVGVFMIALWALARFWGSGDPDGTFAMLALVGLVLGVLGPVVHFWSRRRLYKMRAALAPAGQFLELTDESLLLVVPGKAEVKYAWATFTHTFEDERAITLYVKNSTFHTIPKQGMSPEVLEGLHNHLEHAKRL